MRRLQHIAPPVRRGLFIALVLFVLLVAFVLLVPQRSFGGWDFQVNLWGPDYLLVHGQSPYQTRVLGWMMPLFGQVNAIWFPPAVGLFFPLGWVNMHTATDLWLLLNLLLVPLIIWWSREPGRLPPASLATLAVVLALFPPLLTHEVLGQFSLLPVFLFLVAAQLVARRRYGTAGLLLALILTKPQLAVLAGPGLLLAAYRSGGKRGAVLFAAAGLLGTALLTAPLWIAFPGWVPDFVRAIQDNPSWYQPSLYTLARMWGTPAGWLPPVLLSLGLFALNLVLWWRYPPREVLPWSLALTALASPYIWTWDFVVFLPLICRTVFRQRSGATRAAWLVGVAACFVGMTWIRLTTDNRHHYYLWVPWLVFALVLGSHALESRLSPGNREPLLRPETTAIS